MIFWNVVFIKLIVTLIVSRIFIGNFIQRREVFVQKFIMRRHISVRESMHLYEISERHTIELLKSSFETWNNNTTCWLCQAIEKYFKFFNSLKTLSLNFGFSNAALWLLFNLAIFNVIPYSTTNQKQFTFTFVFKFYLPSVFFLIREKTYCATNIKRCTSFLN